MTTCAGTPGIDIAGDCVAAPPSPLSGSGVQTIQIVTVNASDLDVVANQMVAQNAAGCDGPYGEESSAEEECVSQVIESTSSSELLFFTSTTGYVPPTLSPDWPILVNLGVETPSVGGSGPVVPFSAISPGFDNAFPSQLAANNGETNGQPGQPDEAPGEIRGYLEVSSDGLYTFEPGDYVGFDTVPSGAPAGSMRVGPNLFLQPNPIPDGDSGFAVMTFYPWNLHVGDHLAFYPTNTPDDNPANDTTNVDDLDAILEGYGVIILQAVGTPHEESGDAPAWNDLGIQIGRVGGSTNLFDSLNNPGVAGLDSPTGYALVTDINYGASEATTGPPGQPVSLSGEFSRGPSGLFVPQLTSDDGLVDQSLYQTAYENPTPFPDSTGLYVTALAKVQTRLHRYGFPDTLPLRDEYWADIQDPKWDSYPSDLARIKSLKGVAKSTWATLKPQLLKEFRDVDEVRSVLVDPSGLQSAFDLSNTSSSSTLATLDQDILTQLPTYTQPPDSGPFEAFSIMSIALSIVGAVASLAGPEGAVAGAVVGGLGSVVGLVGNLALAPTGSGTKSFDQQFSDAVSSAGSDLASEFVAATIAIETLAGILVSSYNKLVQSASDFETNPAYQVSDSATLAASTVAYTQAAEQELLKAILPAAYQQLVYGEEATSSSTFPVTISKCLNLPAGSAQTVVDGFYDNGQPFGSVHALMYKIPGGGLNTKYSPPQDLVSLLFDPPTETVQLTNTASLPGAGFDPEAFLTSNVLSSDTDTSGCDFDGNAPGAALSVLDGNQQATSEGGTFGTPVTVRLTDSGGNPIGGAGVTFSLPNSATSPGGTFPGGSSSATATTGSDATATAPVVTANSVAGQFSLDANADGTASPATLIIDGPLALKIVSGNDQNRPVNKGFARLLAVRLVTSGGQPVPGQLVRFSVTSGPASFAFGTAEQVFTDGGGVATATRLDSLATTGAVTVVASFPQEPGVQVTFHLKVT
jgi:hypothetical protein